MKVLKRALIALLAVLATLVIVLLAKTFLTPSKQLQIKPETPLAVNAAAATERLAAAVRLQTISSATDRDANATAFKALHQHIETSFPKFHATAKRELVDGYGLLYTWGGTDMAAKPIALLAHQDVVPVAPGTEKDWTQPPFSGAIADGFVWGRGAWDNKSNLMAQLEAMEMLIASGFKPRQTIYVFFGQDEEVGGRRGALALAERFKKDGIKLDFVLDEGTLIVEGILKGLDKPAALVGMAEKGYLTLVLQATATPGHSSMPPPTARQGAIGMMSAALSRLEDKQFPVEIRGLAADMFDTLAPEMNLLNRVVLSNLWLTKPIVESQLAKASSTAALLRTTTALTVVNAGERDNVLPGRAEAQVNFRVQPGTTSDDVVKHTLMAVGESPIKVDKKIGFSEASKVARIDAPGYQAIAKTLRQLHGDMVVAPSLMLGGTDARHFDDVADNVYRFSPVRTGPTDLARFHGTNERISTANYVEMIQFYFQLLHNVNAAARP
ncbi:MAG: M20 family peptidase [Betaproteobacteria bacterium]|nr:MAG: M20 family peptidase [Betaproteobacteria bacterium]